MRGAARGAERRIYVIEAILELLRPKWCPAIVWKLVSVFLAKQIEKAIEQVLRYWNEHHGHSWINIRQSKLEREALNLLAIK